MLDSAVMSKKSQGKSSIHPAFDLYGALFSVGEAAAVSKVSRPAIDVLLNRGVLEPARREQPSGRRPGSGKKSRGRPMFSTREIFQVRLIREFSAQTALSSSDTLLVGKAADRAKIKPADARKLAKLIAEAGEVAERFATEGEWMWACARSYERGAPIPMYAYATRSEDGGWLLDMHLFDYGEEPSFSWDVPHIFVPMSQLYLDVYVECKKILGRSEETAIDGAQ